MLFSKQPEDWTFEDEEALRSTILRRTKLALTNKPNGTNGTDLVLPELWETTLTHSLSDQEQRRVAEARSEAPNGLVAALREVQVRTFWSLFEENCGEISQPDFAGYPSTWYGEPGR